MLKPGRVTLPPWLPWLRGIIVAIENPSDIIVASQRPYGSRAVLKFSGLATVRFSWDFHGASPGFTMLNQMVMS